MKLQFHVPGARTSEAQWLSEFIFIDQLGLDVVVVPGSADNYRLELDGRQLVVPNRFFARVESDRCWQDTMAGAAIDQWRAAGSEMSVDLISNSIPLLFGEAGFNLDESGNGHLNLDVFGSAFFMLSRYEETVLPDRDMHDRFPATASVAYRAGFLDRPIIDEYVEILWSAMKRVWAKLNRRPRRSRTVVSHDVDAASLFATRSASQTARRAAGDLLKRRDIAKAIGVPWSWLNSRKYIHPEDPFNTFEWIMDTSERHGLTSAFYFICGRTHPAFDAEYEIEHAAIRGLLRRIHERGHEIGLHPSYNSYKDPTIIVREADRLRRVCAEEGIDQAEWGGRMHFLRWQIPTTLHGWEQARMAYDSTLSYADHAGFRCGTCHEYRAFDPVQQQALELRIRPLIAMEGTVMSQKYMGLGTSPAAYEEFIRLKRACDTVGGNFTLLWHNTQLIAPEARLLYESILAG